MDNIQSILSNIPSNFFQGSDDHVDNMAKFSTLVGAVNAVNGDPVKGNKAEIPKTELEKFGNWTGQTDVNVMAKDLLRRGLVGGDKLFNTNIDTSSGESIRTNRSDWITTSAQQILSNALRFGIKDSATFDANIPALTSTLEPRYREALNDKRFTQNYPNFFKVIRDSILPEQYAKFDKNNSQIATK